MSKPTLKGWLAGSGKAPSGAGAGAGQLPPLPSAPVPSAPQVVRQLSKASMLSGGSHSDVCYICHKRGIVMMCEGGCPRSAHLACTKLEEEPDVWVCPFCDGESDFEPEGGGSDASSDGIGAGRATQRRQPARTTGKGKGKGEAKAKGKGNAKASGAAPVAAAVAVATRRAAAGTDDAIDLVDSSDGEGDLAPGPTPAKQAASKPKGKTKRAAKAKGVKAKGVATSYVCEHCNKTLKSATALKYHTSNQVCQTSKKRDGFKCELCGKVLGSKPGYDYHTSKNVCVNRTQKANAKAARRPVRARRYKQAQAKRVTSSVSVSVSAPGEGEGEGGAAGTYTVSRSRTASAADADAEYVPSSDEEASFQSPPARSNRGTRGTRPKRQRASEAPSIFRRQSGTWSARKRRRHADPQQPGKPLASSLAHITCTTSSTGAEPAALAGFEAAEASIHELAFGRPLGSLHRVDFSSNAVLLSVSVLPTVVEVPDADGAVVSMSVVACGGMLRRSAEDAEGKRATDGVVLLYGVADDVEPRPLAILQAPCAEVRQLKWNPLVAADKARLGVLAFVDDSGFCHISAVPSAVVRQARPARARLEPWSTIRYASGPISCVAWNRHNPDEFATGSKGGVVLWSLRPGAGWYTDADGRVQMVPFRTMSDALYGSDPPLSVCWSTKSPNILYSLTSTTDTSLHQWDRRLSHPIAAEAKRRGKCLAVCGATALLGDEDAKTFAANPEAGLAAYDVSSGEYPVAALGCARARTTGDAYLVSITTTNGEWRIGHIRDTTTHASEMEYAQTRVLLPGVDDAKPQLYSKQVARAGRGNRAKVTLTESDPWQTALLPGAAPPVACLTSTDVRLVEPPKLSEDGASDGELAASGCLVVAACGPDGVARVVVLTSHAVTRLLGAGTAY